MKKKILFLAIALTAALSAHLSAAAGLPDRCFTICPCPEEPTLCTVCCFGQPCALPAC